jgi:hypothetical protein
MLRLRLQWRAELLELVATGRKSVADADGELDAIADDIVELRTKLDPDHSKGEV